VSDEGALPHAVNRGGRLFNLLKLTSVIMSSHLYCFRVAMHPKIDSCTETCLIIRNRKPNLASELPSGRGREFTEPFTSALESTTNVDVSCTAPVPRLLYYYEYGDGNGVAIDKFGQ